MAKFIKDHQNNNANVIFKNNTIASSHLSKYSKSKSNTNSTKVIDFVIPRMIKAINYLQSRDIDNDGILEQNHNEDWMDTGLRAGKIVYSQACFILALNNLSYLLSEVGQEDESKRMMKLHDKTITSVEKILWSEEDGSYIDILKSHHIGGPYRVLTQDVTLYLVAISENTNSDSLRIHQIDNIYTSSKENDQKNQTALHDKNTNINSTQNYGNKEHPLKQNMGKKNEYHECTRKRTNEN